MLETPSEPITRELTAAVGPSPERSPSSLFRQHAAMGVVLVTGVMLRLLLALGFPPAFWSGSSRVYLDTADSTGSHGRAGLGYTFLEVVPLSWATSSMIAVSALQHLAGLIAAVAVYVVLVRWGVWRWLAVLAAMVPALDPRLMVVEHLVLPDAAFVALFSLALLALLWRRGPGLVAALTAGLLLGAASTLMADGAVVLVVGALVWLGVSVTVKKRALGTVAFGAAFVAALVPYAAWRGGSAGWQGPWGLSGDGGLDSATDAMAHLAPGGLKASGFAAQTIATTPGRIATPRDQLSTRHPFDDAFLHYAQAVSLPAWLLVVALVIGLAGAVGLARARRSDLQSACAVVVMVPLAAVVGLTFGPEHAWHAHLLLLVWGPACGALGATALMRGSRSPAVGRSRLDDVDHETLRLFAEHYDRPRLAPVVIVIATYNEAQGLPGVLATLPDEVCGLPTDVVVVDDGSSDGTSDVARSQRCAFVACCGRNRGQGAALRLGYRIAREHGARYIITTDADGQYDSRDFPVVLAPLLSGEADFVTGSRRRGHQHTYDRFRRLGVHVFAWVATILTGTWLTDTSFGLRAMRADLTGVVTLDQPQYQSSELLLSAISHGYPVREVPGTMHVRTAGSSKKGSNLVYGAHYARVVFGTWWREGCPRPAADRAAALRPRRKI